MCQRKIPATPECRYVSVLDELSQSINYILWVTSLFVRLNKLSKYGDGKTAQTCTLTFRWVDSSIVVLDALNFRKGIDIFCRFRTGADQCLNNYTFWERLEVDKYIWRVTRNSLTTLPSKQAFHYEMKLLNGHILESPSEVWTNRKYKRNLTGSTVGPRLHDIGWQRRMFGSSLVFFSECMELLWPAGVSVWLTSRDVDLCLILLILGAGNRNNVARMIPSSVAVWIIKHARFILCYSPRFEIVEHDMANTSIDCVAVTHGSKTLNTASTEIIFWQPPKIRLLIRVNI